MLHRAPVPAFAGGHTSTPGHCKHIMLQQAQTLLSQSTITCARTHILCQNKPVIGRHQDPLYFHSIDTSKHMRASKALTTGRLLLDPSNMRVLHWVCSALHVQASTPQTEPPAQPVQRSCKVYLPRLSVTSIKLHKAQSHHPTAQASTQPLRSAQDPSTATTPGTGQSFCMCHSWQVAPLLCMLLQVQARPCLP